jgi:PAS domain S-box-containing protein
MKRVVDQGRASERSFRDEKSHAVDIDRRYLDLGFEVSLLDHVTSAIIATDPEGMITHWNRHAEVLYLWRREEVLGKSIFEVNTPQSSLGEARRILDAVAAAGRWEGEFIVHRRDGSTFPAHTSLSAIRGGSGQLLGFVGVSSDITRRRQAEESTRALQSQLILALRAARMVAWQWNASTGVATRFGDVQQLMDVAPDAGQPEFLERVHPEDRQRVAESIRRAVEAGVPFSVEYRIVHRGGVVFHVRDRGLVQHDDSGARVLTGVLMDVTQQKQLEGQLRETQKLESLGILAGGIAHDFNNLLVGIVGNASLAQELLSGLSPVRPLLDEVVRAGERAAHLTQQMLAYAGKGRVAMEPVNPNHLIREMASLVRSSISKKVELRFDLDPSAPAIDADVGQMQQVVMNLMINGAEAIGEEDEGTVTVRTSFLRDEEQLCLEVEDTGHGMDEATKAHIFDPFFTTKFTGRGLGLAAVQGIVRRHKGSITVDSVPGRGTTFRVCVPASA